MPPRLGSVPVPPKESKPEYDVSGRGFRREVLWHLREGGQVGVILVDSDSSEISSVLKKKKRKMVLYYNSS